MSDEADFIRRLVSAWECCATCAGGVLLRHDRAVRAGALEDAAGFLATTMGIGRRSSEYADGWYDAGNYATAELRNLAAAERSGGAG